MGDESDWESVNDFDTNSEDSQILVEMPPGGISAGICESPFASMDSFSIGDNVGGMTVQSHAGSYVSSYVNLASIASFSDHTLGSLVSSFELVSLASGEDILHCKRCSSRHPIGTAICNLCYLSLCANPCVETDEQIAIALQRQEEKAANMALGYREKQFHRLKDESPFNQAKFLTDDLITFLVNKVHLNFRVFPEMDLMFLAMAFITYTTEATTEPFFSIAYKITNESDWDKIRRKGFGVDETVHVGTSVDNAIEMKKEADTRWGAFFSDACKKSNSGASTVLDSIPEGDSVELQPELLWVLVLVETLASRSEWLRTNTRILGSGNQVLPIACFDAKQCLDRREEIERLANGLLHVCCDFLRDGLELSRPLPPVRTPFELGRHRPPVRTPSSGSERSE